MKYISVILLLLVMSCAPDTEIAVPTDLIPSDQLISITIDLETVEAYFEQVHKKPLLYRDALDSSTSLVLKEHGVTREQLESSLDYYIACKDSIYLLYEAALDSVNNTVNSNK